jgi:hypothetical protein
MHSDQSPGLSAAHHCNGSACLRSRPNEERTTRAFLPSTHSGSYSAGSLRLGRQTFTAFHAARVRPADDVLCFAPDVIAADHLAHDERIARDVFVVAVIRPVASSIAPTRISRGPQPSSQPRREPSVGLEEEASLGHPGEDR